MNDVTADLVPLSEICEKMFGLSLRVARRKAATGTLPVKAFRMSGNKRGPLFVHKADLEKLVDTARSEKT